GRKIIDRIDTLLNTYHDSRVADVLNAEGYKTTHGKEFRNATVGHIRRTYGLKSFYDRFHEQKKYTIKEIAYKLGVSYNMVDLWIKNQIIKAHLHTGRKIYICELNPENFKKRLTSEYRAGRRPKDFYNKIMNRLNEVQLEGGFDEQGRFIHVPLGDLSQMSEYFRRVIINFFLQKKLESYI
ncbi:unnamed protein product, partial [marine sediment metagenome]